MRVKGGSGPRYRRSGPLQSSCGDPWETVKFEACGGAKRLRGPERWLGPLCVYCKLVVESRSRRAKKTSENSDNLMDINKNMAKLGEEILGKFGDFTIAENFSDKSSSN